MNMKHSSSSIFSSLLQTLPLPDLHYLIHIPKSPHLVLLLSSHLLIPLMQIIDIHSCRIG